MTLQISKWAEHLIILQSHAEKLLEALHAIKHNLESISSPLTDLAGLSALTSSSDQQMHNTTVESTCTPTPSGTASITSSPNTLSSPQAASNGKFHVSIQHTVRKTKPILGFSGVRLLADPSLKAIFKQFNKKFPELPDLTKVPMSKICNL
jgi:hypothetical protein